MLRRDKERVEMTDVGQGRLSSPVDGTAGLPPAPEMPRAPRQLRLVPKADLVHRSLGQAIYQLRAMVCLGGRRSAPERTGIGSVSMKLHHPVEEFAHGRGLLVEAHEVPEVTARFLDDPRVVVVLGSFVSGD